MKIVEESMLSLLPNGKNVSCPLILFVLPGMCTDLGEDAQPDETLKAFIWITHEASQADRVGTRTLDISQQ